LERKKVLIITYYWPPSGGPGVQRWLKFTKYFRNFGIEPVIVTVSPEKASYPILDDSLVNQIPEGVRVEYTDSFEPLKLFSSFFRKEKVPYAGIPERKNMSLVGKIALFIRANFFVPDARVGWNKFAIKKCEEIIRHEKIDFIVTTSPPHSTQLIGLALKKKFKLKWLADLRDPWTDIYYYKNFHHTRLTAKKDANLEKEVLRVADIVTVTSESTGKLFSSKLNSGLKKFHVVTNGYDEEDLPDFFAERRNPKFTITFSGTINKQFGLDGFLNAVKNLIDEGLSLQLNFVGNTEPTLMKEISNFLPDTAFLGYLSHKKSIQIISEADLLLLVIPKGNNSGTVPGKTFEYLSTCQPILCLSPENGDAGKIIESCEAGKSIKHDDVLAIKNYINSCYKRWINHESLMIQNDYYKSYSRSETTRRMAEIIKTS
jgi:glycosyltransferase involved in cell wall biosynthesis